MQNCRIPAAFPALPDDIELKSMPPVTAPRSCDEAFVANTSAAAAAIQAIDRWVMPRSFRVRGCALLAPFSRADSVRRHPWGLDGGLLPTAGFRHSPGRLTRRTFPGRGTAR